MSLFSSLLFCIKKHGYYLKGKVKVCFCFYINIKAYLLPLPLLSSSGPWAGDMGDSSLMLGPNLLVSALIVLIFWSLKKTYFSLNRTVTDQIPTENNFTSLVPCYNNITITNKKNMLNYIWSEE